MSTVSDPELLSFAVQVLERHQALVELQAQQLVALLPADLAGDLGLPEETRIGADDTPLLYNSPLLDRLTTLAVRDVPVVYGQIEVPYLKKAGFDQLLRQDLVFADGQVRVVSRAEARTTYMVLACHYVALSDERKEGLVRVCVHDGSGAVVEGIEDGWREMDPRFFDAGKVPPHFPVHLDTAVENAMRQSQSIIQLELADFMASMERRLRRDITNTREYYQALQKEMEGSLSHPNLSETQRQERQGKITELPRECGRKIADLEQKYQIQVTCRACAALRFLVNVAQVLVEIRYRKLQRTFKVTWNPVTRRLDPMVCEHCRQSIRRIVPQAVDAELRLLCLACTRKP